jgi:hypothetical protein
MFFRVELVQVHLLAGEECERTEFSTRIVGREKLNFLTRIKKTYLSLYGDCRTLLTVHSATNTVQIYMYGFFYTESW